MLTILGSIVDGIGRGLCDHFNQHEHLHFDNEKDIHTNTVSTI